ncbi:MAG: spermidine synthase [Candidatus Limnocylindria bacterium]
MSTRLRLVLLSFLMLFVELALIRWTGSNVVYLSYFSNFVLLGSFLGIGIGFLRARARVDLFPYAPIALAFLVGFTLAFNVEIDRSGSELIYFGSFRETGLPIWAMLPVIFVAVATVMAMLAEGVARTFVEFEPLEAYRLDIAGSLLGILGFTALSFASAPPVVWGVVAGALLLLLVRRGWLVLRVVAVVGLAIMLGRESIQHDSLWSPYYKIRVAEYQDEHHVSVNGIPHQAIVSVDRRRELEPVYFVPYERSSRDEPGNVLIVGAGTGGDVAIALEEGATRIDAVEIDPQLQRLGEELNADRPYDDARVEVVIDDGRAHLERTAQVYDTILFALPDSLTLVSGQSSLRLESYLFTEQAIAAARDRLAPDGIFAMYNYYREQWLIDRLAATLNTVYGHAPCVDEVGGGGLAALTIGRSVGGIDCPAPWVPSNAAPAPVTDDYPFLYLREPTIPAFYLVSIGLILLASLAMIRVAGGRFTQMHGYLDLFLMGAAFLLLETKSVVQFALLFGTTWFVNALVFAGVLASVLAAIEVTRRVPLPRPAILYGLLVAAVLVGWLVPAHALLPLPFWLRFVAAVAVWFTPIFVANLIFAQRFRDVEDSTSAFGANLLGAMIGGLIEYAALMTGYQALALVVAVLYVGALVATPGTRRVLGLSADVIRSPDRLGA